MFFRHFRRSFKISYKCFTKIMPFDLAALRDIDII
jgi:hypothetical protein